MRVPNVFQSVYQLAKNDIYDSEKWRELLVGICRKNLEKHSIKDMCLLYYSLAKGVLNKDLSTLSIKYQCRETREVCGPFTVKDISDKYLNEVTRLYQYMNTKQLAMVTQSILILNRLDDNLCEVIIKRLTNKQLKIRPRSLTTLVLTLVRSECINSDVVRGLLLKNINILSQANKYDTTQLFKAIAIAGICDEIIMDSLVERAIYYSTVMSCKELISVLHSIYKLNYKDESLFSVLYQRFQSIVGEFDTGGLLLIAKYFSHYNPKYIKDVFHLQLNQVFFRQSDATPVDDILLFSIYSTKSGASVPVDGLANVLNRIDTGLQWERFFNVLYNHSLLMIEDNELWYRALNGLKMNYSSIDLQYIFNIIGYIIESKRYDEELINLVLNDALANYRKYPIDSLVELTYKLHTIESKKLNELVNKVLEDVKKLDFISIIKINSILFSRGEVNDELIRKIRPAMTIDEHSQWLMHDTSVDSNTLRIYKNVLNRVPRELLEHLLFNIVLSARINIQRGDCDTIEYDIANANKHIKECKGIIIYLLKNIKRNKLASLLLYYIKKISPDVYHEITNVTHLETCADEPIIHCVEIDESNNLQSIVIEFDNFLFKPIKILGKSILGYDSNNFEIWNKLEVKLLQIVYTQRQYNSVI